MARCADGPCGFIDLEICWNMSFTCKSRLRYSQKRAFRSFVCDEIRVERAPHLDGVLDGLEAGLRLREGLVVVRLVLLPKSRLLVDGLPNSSLLSRALFF